MAHSLFSEVPERFFNPLASKHREHYSQLLLRYYALFETYSTGVERELVLSSFEEYFEEDTERTEQLLSEIEEPEELSSRSARELAALFLRRLLSYGWMSEEVLADYTRMINITLWSRPFYQAIIETVRGLQVEYESHIIGIYSSLCSPAAQDQGHHAVLNAHNHTRELIDSLKTLSQNMRVHIERMFSQDAEVKDLLHIHYDLYMQEIVDKAYTRLKTSENLSKYRPQVIRAVNEFLSDEQWMERSTARLAVIKAIAKDKATSLLVAMLHDIRDELRSLDPILEEIDDKNRQYSRISTERIKTHLYADASLQGKLQQIINQIGEDHKLHELVIPKLVNSSSMTTDSLYTPRRARSQELEIPAASPPEFDLELMEKELHLKIHNQLSPKKILSFLSDHRPSGTLTVAAADMIEDEEDFIRILYATAYAEGRGERFPYRVTWGNKIVKRGRYSFREHTFTYTGEDTHE